MSSTHPRLLVTGAGGHLGRNVVEQLLKAGTANVVAGSRYPEALAELGAKGAETVEVNFGDSDTLRRAFSSVDRALVISMDAGTPHEQRMVQQLAVVASAQKAHVERIVYTSTVKPEPGSLLAHAPVHYQTEQAIERSGIQFTILRVNSYSHNAFWWLPPILSSRRWVTSAGKGRVAYIDRRSVACAAAAALTSSEALGRVDIGGFEALSADDVISFVKEIFDISVTLEFVTDEQREGELVTAGVAAPAAKHLTAIDTATRIGDFDSATDIVERLKGSPPQSFREFLIENRDGLLAEAKRRQQY